MAKYLEIKRLNAPNYTSIEKETEKFRKPVIFELPKYNDEAVQKLKAKLMEFENNGKNERFSEDENLSDFDEATSKTVTKDYENLLFMILTKDKVASPIEFKSKKYIEAVEEMTKFVFETDFLKEKLEKFSLLFKLILFMVLKKGLFGKFSLSNISSFVDVTSFFSHGNTNTFIHADAGCCGFFMQMEGSKKWWIASPLQNKKAIEAIFQSDSTKLNLNEGLFDEFEYYNFELRQGEMFYLPPNWLHGVMAPEGSNLSLAFRFPMNLKEASINMMYWKSIGLPLNHLAKSSVDENKTMADIANEQAEAFDKLTFYLRPHSFSSPKIKKEEVRKISGLYANKKLEKAITGGE